MSDFAARYADAVGRLSSAQKPAAVTSAYLRYVNRPLGGRLAAAAHALGATPNQVTAVSALFAAAGLGAVAVRPPSPALGVSVSLALLIGYALDSADGQLARLRGGGSAAGEWLDHVVDCARAVVQHSVVLVSTYRYAADATPTYLFVPVGFLFVTVVFTFGVMLRDQLLRARTLPARPTARDTSRVRSLLLLPVDYAAQCVVFSLLGWPTAFRWGYAGLGLVTALFAARALVRSYRTLSRATRPPG